MAPKFGTSGLRGLVAELSDGLVANHVAAFLTACPHGGTVHVGRDLRPSSPRIAQAVMGAAAAQGIAVVDCGAVPTPALALAAMQAGSAAVMVTGSHRPADRNGLKFYTPGGEITKAEETAILSALGEDAPVAEAAPALLDAEAPYAARYRAAFGSGALDGLRIGVYQHSSVARDLLTNLVVALGGEAVPLERAEAFVPVDTEAVDAQTRRALVDWSAAHRLDAVISTDGDADRPMVADAAGRLVPGDVLGALTARALGAAEICTPVSSNTMIDEMGDFSRIRRTRIGSPFVIEAMEATRAEDPDARVVGYEANGGFLLGFAAQGPAGELPSLMTRDCLLPILSPLATARAQGLSLADLVTALPQRFTAADRIAGIAADRAQDFLSGLRDSPEARGAFFETVGPETAVDRTDGLRVTFASGDIVHLRPSGNAPEFRCYAEAGRPEAAEILVARHLEKLRHALA